MFNRLFNFFKDLSKGTISYGILRPCFRCVYGKSIDHTLILNHNGIVKCIISPHRKLYVRRGNCLGIRNCTVDCLEEINNKSDRVPCEWISFKG